MTKAFMQYSDEEDTLEVSATGATLAVMINGVAIEMPAHIGERLTHFLQVMFTEVKTEPTPDQRREQRERSVK